MVNRLENSLTQHRFMKQQLTVLRAASLGVIAALAGAAVPAFSADQSAQIEARVGAWGRNCKNAIAERITNASMADIRVSLSATTRSSIDAGDMTLKDIKQYGLIYNWQRPFPDGSALKGTCYVDGKGNVTKVD